MSMRTSAGPHLGGQLDRLPPRAVMWQAPARRAQEPSDPLEEDEQGSCETF